MSWNDDFEEVNTQGVLLSNVHHPSVDVVAASEETDCVWVPSTQRCLRVLVVCADYTGLQESDMEQEVEVVESFCGRLNVMRPNSVEVVVVKRASRKSLSARAFGPKGCVFDVIHIIAHGNKAAKSLALHKDSIQSGNNNNNNNNLKRVSKLDVQKIVEELDQFADVQVMEWWKDLLTAVASPYGALLLLQGCNTAGLGAEVKNHFRVVSATNDLLGQEPAVVFAKCFYDGLLFRLSRLGQYISLRSLWEEAFSAADATREGYPGVLLEGVNPDYNLISQRQNWLRLSKFVHTDIVGMLKERLLLVLPEDVDAEDPNSLQRWFNRSTSTWTRCMFVAPELVSGASEWGIGELFLVYASLLLTGVPIERIVKWEQLCLAVVEASMVVGLNFKITDAQLDSVAERFTAIGMEDVVLPPSNFVMSESLLPQYEKNWKETAVISEMPWRIRIFVPFSLLKGIAFLMLGVGLVCLILSAAGPGLSLFQTFRSFEVGPLNLCSTAKYS